MDDEPLALSGENKGGWASLLGRPVAELYQDREALCKAATLASAGVTPELKQCVYLYYIARYLVAVVEARFLDVPMQVWNEYRNALDHYMRYLSLRAEDDTEDHLRKMEGHLQRAVLDAAKILCIRLHERLAQEVEQWGRDAFELIDSGDFIVRLEALHRDAVHLFERAKVNDSQLGRDLVANTVVINGFIDAFFGFDFIDRELALKKPALIKAKQKIIALEEKANAAYQRQAEEIRAEISPRAFRRAVWVGLLTGIPLTIAGSLLGWLLGSRYPNPPFAPPSATGLIQAPAAP